MAWGGGPLRRAGPVTLARTGVDNDGTAAFSRWAGIILHAACTKLDDQTRVYLTMRLDRQPVAAIADTLGTTEQALKNEFGGMKLVRKARAAVRQVVVELP